MQPTEKDPRNNAGRVDESRRAAVQRLISTGFALPVMVSIAVSALPIRAAYAQSTRAR